MKKENKIEVAKEIFKKFPTVKLAYLFGSQARNEAGILSDYDFAIFADERDRNRLFDLKLLLMNDLSRIFGENKTDVLMLNTAKSPELKYNAIREGKLIYEKEPFKVLVEPAIFNEYFDFHDMLLRHKLTKV